MGQLIEEMAPFYLKSLDQHFLSAEAGTTSSFDVETPGFLICVNP